MLKAVRLLLFAALIVFAACTPEPAPSPAAPATPDPTTEPWYSETTEQLVALNREAEQLFRGGRSNEAGELVMRGQGVMKRLVSVPRPTLAATEAASDLDDLYGRMLLSNQHYGWARMFFQKNVARWKNWRPRTEESARRLKLAESRIEECDRHLGQ